MNSTQTTAKPAAAEQNIRMAIYWTKLQELDVYTRTEVRTLSGPNARAEMQQLYQQAVPVEIMD